MAKKFNPNLIKEEIDSRKQAKGQQIKASGGMQRDEFLGDLVSALNNGTPSKAAQKLKVVEGIANTVGVAATDGNGGAVITRKANPNAAGVVSHQQPQQPQYPVNEQQGMMPEREELYDAQVNNLVNQYRTGAPITNYGNTNPYGMNGMLTEQQMLQMAQHQQGQPVQQQGNFLVEQVNHAVDGFMNEHFSGIVQEAMKNTIVEMYSVERVKKTLEENKDMIRGIVVEVIKELQERKAAKSRN